MVLIVVVGVIVVVVIEVALVVVVLGVMVYSIASGRDLYPTIHPFISHISFIMYLICTLFVPHASYRISYIIS